MLTNLVLSFLMSEGIRRLEKLTYRNVLDPLLLERADDLRAGASGLWPGGQGVHRAGHQSSTVHTDTPPTIRGKDLWYRPASANQRQGFVVQARLRQSEENVCSTGPLPPIRGKAVYYSPRFCTDRLFT